MEPLIAVITGSKSDLDQIGDGLAVLDDFNIPYIREVISAHRNPDELREFCKSAKSKGIKVIIGCAGMAAALPGFAASYTDIPVIGVPLKGGMIDGIDALLSIAQTPKGIGLVSTGVGKSGFINAVIFAVKILSLTDTKFSVLLEKIMERFKR